MTTAPDLRSLLEKSGLKPIHLARMAAVDKASVSRWMRGRVPAERVLTIEKVTGIPRHELRPDLYPPPEAA